MTAAAKKIPAATDRRIHPDYAGKHAADLLTALQTYWALRGYQPVFWVTTDAANQSRADIRSNMRNGWPAGYQQRRGPQ